MGSETSFNDLSDGLVADILSRLPVKQVIQFMCLRKVWHSLIKSPFFVSLHHSRSLLQPSNNYIFLVHPAVCKSAFGLISDSPRVRCLFSNQFNIENDIASLKGFEIRGASKGLVCLTPSYGRDKSIYLINPFIRKCKKLVLKSSCYANLIHRSNVGISFGYSYSDDDYKVLRIIRVLDRKSKVSDNNRGYYIEIYSLRDGQWKIVEFSMDIEFPIFRKATYAHGCLYWCVDETPSYLLCFNLKDEMFSKIELPETYMKLSSRHCSRTFNKNDSVVIVFYNVPRYGKIKITLLVMEKNFDGHVQWHEFSYSDSENVLGDSVNEDSDYEDEGGDNVCPLGFSAGGRFIFETSSQKTYRKKRHFISVDLVNSCALEKLRFCFDTKLKIQNGWPEDIDYNDGVTNVMESLVLFCD